MPQMVARGAVASSATDRRAAVWQWLRRVPACVVGGLLGSGCGLLGLALLLRRFGGAPAETVLFASVAGGLHGVATGLLLAWRGPTARQGAALGAAVSALLYLLVALVVLIISPGLYGGYHSAGEAWWHMLAGLPGNAAVGALIGLAGGLFARQLTVEWLGEAL